MMKWLKKKWNKQAKNPLKNRKIIGAFLFTVTIGAYLVIGARFSWIMVSGNIAGQDLDQNVQQLYSSENVVQAERGTIFDRNGNPIATDANSYKMIAVLTDEWSTENKPIHVQQPEEVAKVLSNHLAISEEEALNKLTSDASQVEFGSIGTNLSYDTVSNIQEELNEKGLTGIDFGESQSRLYPNGTFASNIVGLAQHNSQEDKENNNQLAGVMGIEAQFNEQLTGQNGALAYQEDSSGYALPNGEVEAKDKVDGQDIYLTLDRSLQIHLENIMSSVEEEHSPRAMTATLMDADNGEIIASAQRPSFNATTKEGIDDSWQNLLVEYGFEPGSTIKILTLAAAIEEGVFNPEETFQSGSYETQGGTVNDVNPEGWGEISYLEGLFRSSNVGFVKLVEEMGLDTWKEYLDAFGFGQATGIQLPNELGGSNPYNSPLQQVNTAFGQGISVTPVQMLQAFSAVANGGEMVQPRIVGGISDSETGETTEAETVIKESPISEETASKTLEYLNMGTEADIGTMRQYAIDGVNVAAKTGTSQLVNPDTGEYYSSHPNYNYSATAMMPAEDPEVIMYITVQEPDLTEDATYGGAVVEKIYHPFMNRVLDQINSNESEDSSGEQANEDINQTPDYTDLSLEDAMARAEELGLDVGVIGNGDKVVQQAPQANTPIYDSQRIVLMTNGAMSLPDMTGWSRNDVLKVGELTGVNFTFEGEGYVSNQELEPGSFIEPGDEVLVELNG